MHWMTWFKMRRLIGQLNGFKGDNLMLVHIHLNAILYMLNVILSTLNAILSILNPIPFILKELL